LEKKTNKYKKKYKYFNGSNKKYKRVISNLKLKKSKTIFSKENNNSSSEETKYKNVNIYQIGSISNNNNFIFNKYDKF